MRVLGYICMLWCVFFGVTCIVIGLGAGSIELLLKGTALIAIAAVQYYLLEAL